MSEEQPADKKERTGEPDSPSEVPEPSTVDLRTLLESRQEPAEPTVAPAPGIPVQLPQLERGLKIDLGKRLGIDISDIGLVSMEAVTWPDSSLGCPQPGMLYTQVLTPGYRIVLHAKGQEYRYHARGTSVFVLCDR